MREFLNPLKDGGYELSDTRACVDSIEVPDGAEVAFQATSDSTVVFKRSECGYSNAVVVWRRSKPVDAELESENPWDTQVGGDHYKHYKIQPMQFALENNLNPLQHSVIKYVMRHKEKNGKQDLERAKHYIDLMISHYYG